MNKYINIARFHAYLLTFVASLRRSTPERRRLCAEPRCPQLASPARRAMLLLPNRATAASLSSRDETPHKSCLWVSLPTPPRFSSDVVVVVAKDGGVDARGGGGGLSLGKVVARGGVGAARAVPTRTGGLDISSMTLIR